MYQVAAGSSFAASLNGLLVVSPFPSMAAGYPTADLVDEFGDVVQSTLALPGAPATTFDATLAVPAAAEPPEGHDLVAWAVRWTFESVAGERWTFVEPLHVLSSQTVTVDTEVFIGFDEEAVMVNLPFTLGVGDTAALYLYDRNVAVGTPVGASTVTNQGSACRVTFAWVPSDPTLVYQRLDPYDGFVRGVRGPSLIPYVQHRPIYYVTPSILGAISQLDHMLNKSRVQRVVSSLHYTRTDMMQYLNMGLAWFNSAGSQLTDFNGRNMQGALLNSWLTLSHYYGLLAQLGAHVDLDFNMSGQSVTLQVDQRAGIESILGLVSAELERSIIPFKKLLAKAGIVGGDGNVVPASNGSAMGHVQTGNHSMLNLNLNGRPRSGFIIQRTL